MLIQALEYVLWGGGDALEQVASKFRLKSYSCVLMSSHMWENGAREHDLRPTMSGLWQNSITVFCESPMPGSLAANSIRSCAQIIPSSVPRTCTSTISASFLFLCARTLRV